jgi:hypothetical protein
MEGIMRNLARGLLAAACVWGVGCSNRVDVDKLPEGTEVQVTRQDGALIEGKLAAREPDVIKVSTGRTTKDVPRDQIADVRVVDEKTPAELPEKARFREVTLPAGTDLTLELTSPVSSATANPEDPVTATLQNAVVVEGVDVLPAGSTARGEVTAVERAGKVKGRARLALRFHTINAGGETYRIAAPFDIVAPATKGEDARKIGLPAAGGAVVGGILGGKKGAAIGAVIGGGAGTAHVLMTPGEEVTLKQGMTLNVSLTSPIDVKVALK